MKHEQEPQEYEAMYLHLGEAKFSFTKNFGFGFKHKEPKHDHVYIVVNGTPANPEQVVFLFRELFETHKVDMDEFLAYMEEMEFYVEEKDEAGTFDLQAYDFWKKNGKTDRPLLINVEQDTVPHIGVKLDDDGYPIAPELETYGPTKEEKIKNYANYIAYLFETNRGHLL